MNKFEKVLIFCFIAFACLVFLAVFILRQQGSVCIQEPLVYGVKEYTKQIDRELECACSFNNVGQSRVMLPFVVNSTGMFFQRIQNPSYESIYEPLNYSELNDLLSIAAE